MLGRVSEEEQSHDHVRGFLLVLRVSHVQLSELECIGILLVGKYFIVEAVSDVLLASLGSSQLLKRRIIDGCDAEILAHVLLLQVPSLALEGSQTLEVRAQFLIDFILLTCLAPT